MMFAVLAAASALSLATSADYAPSKSVLTVCDDPHLVVIARLRERTGVDEEGSRAFSGDRCSGLILQDRVFVDFIEDVPWKIEATGMHGVAKVARGRYPVGNGTWVYFYGLAADFKYIGASRP